MLNGNTGQELKPTEDVVQEALKIAGVVQNPFLEEQMLPAWQAAPAEPLDAGQRSSGLGAQLFALVQSRPSEPPLENGQAQLPTPPPPTQPGPLEPEPTLQPLPTEHIENQQPLATQEQLQQLPPLHLDQLDHIAQADSADKVNILDTLKNIERVLKAEEDQVVSMYSQINPIEGQSRTINAEPEKLSTIREQHSVEVVTTPRGGVGAMVIPAEPMATVAGVGDHG